MNLLTDLVHISLSNFPKSLQRLARLVLPTPVKRYLAENVVKNYIGKIESSFIEVKDGRKFKLIEDGHFLRIIYEKNYEPLLSAIANKLIVKGDNAVDVGANFGWYTTLFCLKSNSGKIISYEPVPYSHDILQENIALNNMSSHISVRNVGIANKSGTLLMEPTPNGNVSGSLAHIVNNESDSTIEVEVVTLDEDLSYLTNEISYIKIDIEGFEYSALKGASNILNASNQPILQIELNDKALLGAGSSRKEVIKYLKNIGYSFYEATHNSPGYLQKTNAKNCSDVFCFGRGKYTQRLSKLLLS